MAVSGDFFSVPGIIKIRTAAETDFNLLMLSQGLNLDNLIQKTIDDLTSKIKQLKSQEGQFLSMFECLDIKEFRDRVRNYYNYTSIGTFTGSKLRKIIEDFEAIHDEKIKVRQDYIERIIYNLLNNPKYSKEFSADLMAAFTNNQVTDEAANEMVQMVISMLSGAGLGGGGYLRLSSKRNFGKAGKSTNGQQMFEVAARFTTDAFNEHLMDLYAIMKSGQVDSKVEQQLNKDIYYRNLSEKGKRDYLNQYIQTIKTRAYDLLQPIPVKTKISGARMEQTFSYKINQAIESATGGIGKGSGKAKDIDEKDPLLVEANQKIQEAVVEELMSNAPEKSAELKQFINDRIHSMLQADPKMFFVGHSSEKLEGVLGEISAICALTMLLGKKYRPRILKWVGSQLGVKKKQPSVDIALQAIGGIQFGIQIKNTMDDLSDDFLHNIKFVDTSVDLVLKKLGINSTNFENVFFADNFNVPYKQEGNRYVEKSGATRFEHGGSFPNGTYQEYLDEDAAIDNIVADIYSYLTLFASDFLYIGMDKGFKSKLATLDMDILTTGGNYVYIVGSQVFFASEMLEQLQQDLQILQLLRKETEITSFKLDTYIEKQKGDAKGSYNIVSVLNGKGGEATAHTVKLKSSWNFSR